MPSIGPSLVPASVLLSNAAAEIARRMAAASDAPAPPPTIQAPDRRPEPRPTDPVLADEIDAGARARPPLETLDGLRAPRAATAADLGRDAGRAPAPDPVSAPASAAEPPASVRAEPAPPAAAPGGARTVDHDAGTSVPPNPDAARARGPGGPAGTSGESPAPAAAFGGPTHDATESPRSVAEGPAATPRTAVDVPPPAALAAHDHPGSPEATSRRDERRIEDERSSREVGRGEFGHDEVGFDGRRPADRAAAPVATVDLDALDGFARGDAQVSGLQTERAGVIASFILNAAMIPGWPPPRPFATPSASALLEGLVTGPDAAKEAALAALLGRRGGRASLLARLRDRLARLARSRRLRMLLGLTALSEMIGSLLDAVEHELAELGREDAEGEPSADEFTERRRLTA